MFIHDLEFVNSFKEFPSGSFAIEGGASAEVNVSANAIGSESIYVDGDAIASGDFSRAGVTFDAKLINRSPNPRGYGGYKTGYGAGYAVGFAHDRYGSTVTAYNRDRVVI